MNKKLLTVLGLALCVLALSVTALAASPGTEPAGEAQFTDVSGYVLHLGGFPKAVDGAKASDTRDEPYADAMEALYEGLAARAEQIDLSAYSVPTDDLWSIYTQVLNEHAELFYVEGGYSSLSDGGYVTVVFPRYSSSYGAAEVAAFHSTLEGIMAMVDPSWSELETVLFFHDYLVTHCEYDLSYSRYNAYDVLVRRSAVCQGYAEAFQMLCRYKGIGCAVVSSDAINHAWNLVTVGGENFFVDCTWDDPSNQWYEGLCQHENFLLSTAALSQSHGSTDWVVGTQNIYASSGASSRYDDAFWQNVNTAIPLIGHVGAYTLYTDENNIHLYNFSSGEAASFALPVPGRWNVWGGSGWWVGNNCSIAALGGRYYFALPEGIWSLAPDGAMAQVYELSDAERAQGYIYGIVNDGGTLYYNIGTEACNTVFTRAALSLDLAVDAAIFPDAAFRAYVAANIDADQDGLLSEAEREAVTRLYVPDLGIASLQGVEYFGALTWLDCNRNALTELDLSRNIAISVLYLDNNAVTQLDLSANSALTVLRCDHNQLSTLDLSAAPALSGLKCADNRLTSLNVSGCDALQYLDCSQNQLTELDLSGKTGMAFLLIEDNRFGGSLDLRGFTALMYLYCSGNGFTDISVNGCSALRELHCYQNGLGSLDLRGCTALECLLCHDNRLTSFNVSMLGALRILNCRNNLLTALDVSQNPELMRLSCYGNSLSMLDITDNAALVELVNGAEPENAEGGLLYGEADDANENMPCLYVDADTLLITDGIIPPVMDGLGFDGTAWHYYVNGRIDYGYTGLAYREDIGWWYVSDGTIDFTYTGFAEGAQVGWWYCEGGTISFNYTGVGYGEGLGWAYAVNGAFAGLYNGLWYAGEEGWVYLVDGQIDEGFRGLAYREDIGWWYVRDGHIQFDYSGLASAGDAGWWFVRNGTIDFNYTGFADEHELGLWYVEGGRLMFDYSGLAYDEAVGWRYVSEGEVVDDYTGLAYSPAAGWWYMQDGEIRFDFTGIANDPAVGCWYVEDGTINFGFTGLYQDLNLGWVYVAGGMLRSDYTGLVYDPAVGWWYVRNGSIDFDFTGIAYRADIGWWYVEGGSITFTYNGIVEYGGQTWSVINSQAIPMN